MSLDAHTYAPPCPTCSQEGISLFLWSEGAVWDLKSLGGDIWGRLELEV